MEKKQQSPPPKQQQLTLRLFVCPAGGRPPTEPRQCSPKSCPKPWTLQSPWYFPHYVSGVSIYV